MATVLLENGHGIRNMDMSPSCPMDSSSYGSVQSGINNSDDADRALSHIKIEDIPTDLNPADTQTKALSRAKLKTHEAILTGHHQ